MHFKGPLFIAFDDIKSNRPANESWKEQTAMASGLSVQFLAILPTQIDNFLQHLPPQSIEAEKAVIGALIKFGKVFDEVSFLAPVMLLRYGTRHQALLKAVLSLKKRDAPVGFITVSREIAAMGRQVKLIAKELPRDIKLPLCGVKTRMEALFPTSSLKCAFGTKKVKHIRSLLIIFTAKSLTN